MPWSSCLGGYLSVPDHYPLVLGCEEHVSSLGIFVAWWSEHWNGVPRTRVRVPVEIHVFHISSIVLVPWSSCLGGYLSVPDDYPLVLGCEEHVSSLGIFVAWWSEHWNGVPRTRVRVPVEIHVFHISSIVLVPWSSCLGGYLSVPDDYPLVLGCEEHVSSLGIFVAWWSEHWNGVPRTRVRVPVEIHVFHISSIVLVPWSSCLGGYLSVPDDYPLVLGCEEHVSSLGIFVAWWSEHWNGVPRTRVRVPVEIHVFHISSIVLVPWSSCLGGYLSVPDDYPLVLGCEEHVSSLGIFVAWWSEHWNGVPRTRVRVPVEIHVFHISSIVLVPWSSCLGGYLSVDTCLSPTITPESRWRYMFFTLVVLY